MKKRNEKNKSEKCSYSTSASVVLLRAEDATPAGG